MAIDDRWKRKPKDQLRHWSTYDSIGAYFADYRGYVPLAMMHGISQTMRNRGLSFVEAYRLLFEGSAIIHVDDTDPAPHKAARRG